MERTVTSYSPSEFEKLQEKWKLLETGDDMTLFQSFDWYRNINNLYQRERTKNLFRRWEYVLVEWDDKPVMIAPIQVVLFGWQYRCVGLWNGFYFIGRQGYTDYLNCIYSEFSEDAFLAIADYLRKKYHKSYFCLEQVLESTELAKFIFANYRSRTMQSYCADLVLPDTFEDYNKLLSKKTRQNIRTAINRQRRDNRELTHSLTYDIDEELASQLMVIRDMRLKDKQKQSSAHASWKGKAYRKARDLMISVFGAEQDVIRENCHPWCFLVKEGDRIASFFWGIYDEARKTYFVILAGLDPAYAWYSPSISHLYLFIKEQYESGNRLFDVLDFTRGGERYKEDMGGRKKIAWTIKFNARKPDKKSVAVERS